MIWRREPGDAPIPSFDIHVEPWHPTQIEYWIQ